MITECRSCRLHETAGSFVFADGDPGSRVVFVGEGPGPDEDREGVPWVGRAGRLLMRLLGEIGLSRSDVYLTNVVRCFPNAGGRVRAPAPGEAAACARRWLFPELRALAPLRVLVPVGGVAVAAILGPSARIGDVRGKILATDWCERTLPVYHPSFLLRAQGSDRDRLMKQAREDFALIRSIAEATAAGLGRVDVAERAAEAKSIQLRDDERAQLEQRIVQAEPWHPGRKYVAGWSDERDVVLLYRDAAGERRLERVSDVPWYFFMRTGDALEVPAITWERWRRLGVFERLDVDPVDADWTRVYAVRRVTQTRWLRDRGEVGVGINILDDPRSRGRADAVAASLGIGPDGKPTARRDRKEAWEIQEAFKRKSAAEIKGALDAEYQRVDEGFAITATRAIGSKGGGLTEASRRIEAARGADWKKYEAEVKLHDFLVTLHKGEMKLGSETLTWRGGPTFEADLTPKQRFMTDRLVEVDDHYSELFFDIETDDSVPGWENKETWRHLAIAAVLRDRSGAEERFSWVVGSETDGAEAAMHRAFRDVIARADILYAWNGFNFDFPILRARFRRYGIEYDWRHVIWCDLLAVWRRYHYRGASAVTSFALADLAPVMLSQEKLDWRTESARRGTPAASIVELYRRNPELLQEYNERDAELLHGLEREYGYAAIERVFCRIGNCFTNDYHVSTKVDMLLLNRGSIRGKHFFTRGLQFDFLPKYIAEMQRQTTRHLGADGEVETVATGAVGRLRGGTSEYTGGFVFEPVVGYHEGVAALDFKSLYPTVMTLFNISPETWVSRDDVEAGKHDRDALIRTPSGAFFLKEPTGMIPLVFRETLEKRKVYTKLQLAEDIGSARFLLYYRLAYAYKRLGLSFYGEIGNETSRYFNPEVAEAVTLGGQWFIKKTAELAGRHGYRVLAGDTDSLYLKMTEAQAEAFVKVCDAYYREAVRPFSVDMSRFLVELEYENYFRNIVFVRKKRYAGKMTMFKGKASEYLEVKGLECMRSDGIEYARALQRKVLAALLDGRRPAASVLARLVAEARDEVYAGNLPLDAIVTTQAIEKSVDEYKTAPPHVRVARHIRDVSTEYYVGMKVPYVMVPGVPDPDKVGKPAPLVAVWAREYAEGTYDPWTIWNKRTFPPTLRVLEAVYPGEDWGRYFVSANGASGGPPRRTQKLKREEANGHEREGGKQAVARRRRAVGTGRGDAPREGVRADRRAAERRAV